MHYDAAIAPISWGSVLFIVPHLIVGIAFLIGAKKGKCQLRGMTGTSGKLLLGGIGALFSGVALFVLVNNSVETYLCKTAVERNDVKTVQGPIQVLEKFSKPGAGYVRFKVGNEEFRTESAGLSCECGFVKPPGRLVKIKDGINVEAKSYGGKVVSLVEKPST